MAQDPYVGERHEFTSWEEFFEDCERLHKLGVPYSLLGPDAATLEALGVMPPAPWV